MSQGSGWIRVAIVSAALTAAALVSTSALAQMQGPLTAIDPIGKPQGCCQGGSATGVSAWSTGNIEDPSSTIIERTGAPPPRDVIFTPIAGNPTPPGAQPGPWWWTHGELEFGGRL